MLKKTITYEDFNGLEQTDDFYFHISTPEMTKMTIKWGGDIADYVKRIAKDEDAEKMIEFIETLVLSAYGKKSEDGKRFVKNAAIREEFEFSQAYAELFEELMLNPSQAKAFGEGLAIGARPSKAAAIHAAAQPTPKQG